MTKRDLAVVTVPSVAVAAYLISEVGTSHPSAWIAGLIAFGITFGGASLFWRRNKHRAGTSQDTADLLPRFKGSKK